jgi:hypothetical protein
LIVYYLVKNMLIMACVHPMQQLTYVINSFFMTLKNDIEILHITICNNNKIGISTVLSR